MSTYQGIAQKRNASAPVPRPGHWLAAVWPFSWFVNRTAEMVAELSVTLLTRLGSIARLDTETINQLQQTLPVAQQVAWRARVQRDRLSASQPALDRLHLAVVDCHRLIGISQDQAEETLVTFERCLQIGSNRTGMIDRLIETVQKSGEGLAELNSNVDEVEGLLHAIQEIGSQTNLLALNASIEAARSGTYGSGFAVVAREMRALADKTGGAAERILEVTGRIRSSSGDAADSIHEALKSTNCHREITEKMRDEIDHCMDLVRELEVSSRQIRLQTQNEREAIESLQQDWSEVLQSAEESVHDALGAHQHGERAVLLAEELQRELRSFGTALETELKNLALPPR